MASPFTFYLVFDVVVLFCLFNNIISVFPIGDFTYIIVLLYYQYTSGIKWSQNVNIIVITCVTSHALKTTYHYRPSALACLLSVCTVYSQTLPCFLKSKRGG